MFNLWIYCLMSKKTAKLHILNTKNRDFLKSLLFFHNQYKVSFWTVVMAFEISSPKTSIC